MVDPISFGSVRPITGQTMAAATANRTTTSAAASTEAGNINLPSLPKLVRLAAEIASEGPPIDYARLAPIRQAIAMGTYGVDPAAIAKALLK
jgi:negative regulator of flagellin synthesis FlgM